MRRHKALLSNPGARRIVGMVPANFNSVAGQIAVSIEGLVSIGHSEKPVDIALIRMRSGSWR